MDTNTQVFFDNATTTGARLTGIVRINCYYLTASFFRFVVEHVQQLAPSSIQNALGQIVISGHAGDIQIFDGDEGISIDELMTKLVREIAALVGSVLVGFGNLPAGIVPTPRAFLASCHTPLLLTQLLFSLAHVTGGIYRIPIRRGDDRGNAQIDTHCWTGMLNRFRIGQFNLKDSIPLVASTLDDDLFDRSVVRDRTVPLDLDLSHPVDMQPVVSQARTVSKHEGNGLEAGTRFETRITWRFTGFDSAKECFEGFVQPAKHLLSSRRAKAGQIVSFLSDRGKLTGLVVITDRDTIPLISVSAFLKSRVVKLTEYLEHLIETFGLFPIGIEAIAV